MKRHQKSSYLFDTVKDYSEWDYVLKLCSPITEELFDSVDTLRIKWGDTVFVLANEDGTTDLKIDIRVILDKVTQMLNVDDIEGKIIVNQLICHYVDVCYIPGLEICGSGLHMRSHWLRLGYMLVISGVLFFG
ncbi:uncharacterized protein EV154DRAFT_571345 [Mucor mucedo]|uniref:uncharacterized protein n=1 Tax=Mucor mucedo TaxID=29922 RepID=UPI0022210E2D|nr:uncharacterized protein EV154DRAFT_571345 [Mucor mucedo]KAI7868669.1 hypothetical protein EV154DRAFT_571345 [Mucor mucedo]